MRAGLINLEGSGNICRLYDGERVCGVRRVTGRVGASLKRIYVVNAEDVLHCGKVKACLSFGEKFWIIWVKCVM